MKINHYSIWILLLPLFLVNVVFCYDDDPVDFAEIHVYNMSTTIDVTVIVRPVGMIFNGKEISGTKDYRLSPEAVNDVLTTEDNFLLGGQTILGRNAGSGISKFYLGWDLDNNLGGTAYMDSLFGIGRYKIEFWSTPDEDEEGSTMINYVFVDYSDWNLPYDGTPFKNDIYIYFYGTGTEDLKFRFDSSPYGDYHSVNNSNVNHELDIWNQIKRVSPFETYYRTPSKGSFKTSSERSENYLLLPIYNPIAGLPTPVNAGSLFMNLSVITGHHAYIKSTETMYIENGGIFNLLSGGILEFLSNSTLFVKRGGKFCNYGGTIIHPHIIYETRGIYNYCNYYNGAINGGDMILEDSAIVEFPDSTTITFDSTSKLIMKPHSEFRMGRYSKIVFENGSSIMCDSAKFTSLDSTQTWDGIYLSGLAYDTLKNCTFQNAVNGINITDKIPTGLYSPPATQITNCVFKNSTSSTLLNYVYIDNSTNVLIKGCSSAKTGSGSFTAGIVAEYCSTNGIVIADNNINYVTTGISLLQSSEYIGRNTITGSTNSGTGMYLDNSNGTIEYNIVNNFQKSIYGSYSSPYLLKNTLSNAYVKGIDLVTSSMPVMKPVVSGSNLKWLGGNNTITGTPSHSGICFVDCYPLMDSGYNKITVGGSDYMNGTFSMALTTVYAKLNYWYDSPPNSHLFDITGGSVNYSNPFDGTTLPSTDATELNSIGWGLYDTVFTKSIGDYSEGEDLFMQAYTEEMSGNFTDAIANYKEVVSSYKTASFAPVSLSRIFNCLGKANASGSDYSAIQSYYSGINSNQTHPFESRELAEDFMIQSKVKQGNIGDAVSDYNDIYEENSTNSKGAHALLNKLCLENMLVTDYSSGTGNHKIDVLSLITGEKININNFTNNNTPSQFKLYQNYPNPFNPVTNIKYEIPRDVNVSIKIYDLLGKEVFSYNDFKKAGSYEVQFDGANFASGMYFYQITAGDPSTGSGRGFVETKKMVLLK